MNNKIFTILAFFLVLSFGIVIAVSGDNMNVNAGGVNVDVNDDGANVNINSGNGSELSVQTGNSGENSQLRVRIQDGEHMGENGQVIQVQTQAGNKVKIQAGGVSVECDCEMEQETSQNKTKLYAKLSNGANAEIKVMPNTASEQALERLRLKVCSSENNCSIELKEVGVGEKTQFAYELKTQKKAKVLGLFGAKMQVQAQVNAEDGEVIRISKPWWAFLASESEE